MNGVFDMGSGPAGRSPNSKREKHPLGVGAVVFLLLLHSVLQGLVLCFGAGGHIAIESEHGVCPHMKHAAGRCADAPLRPSMVSDRIQSVSCSDVAFRLDRLISGTGDPGSKNPVPAGRIPPRYSAGEFEKFRQDRPCPWNAPCDTPPFSASLAVLKC
jgi:hypothetical protein